ncbi:hypothetical protein BDZ91DRAFT_731417 [Kalaharituber pfeilii]|nr:hypothetical protein BDZ91DRAFT_731417 [Kalaharituber pfeilii]
MFPAAKPIPLPPHLLPSSYPPTSTLFFPSPRPPPPGTSPILILFLPGNPGLIGYYHSFLIHLASLIHSPAHDTGHAISILGVSHAGFSSSVVKDGGKDGSLMEGWRERRKETKYYSLKLQILLKLDLLEHLSTVSSSPFYPPDSTTLKPPLKVLLMGHSVGSYICLSLLHSYLLKFPSTPTSIPSTRPNFTIHGGTLLFPTITHIALSPSGQKLTRLIAHLPSLPSTAQFLADILVTLLSLTVLRYLIQLVTRFKHTSSPLPMPSTTSVPITVSGPLESTLAFLTIPGSIYQSLRMAAEEMDQIREDSWPGEVWGGRHDQQGKGNYGDGAGNVKWVCYFGREDHWVDEKKREKIIVTRGGRGAVGGRNGEKEEDKGYPKMVVCEKGLPHGFCIGHGEVMAESVFTWLQDIIAEL